MSVEGRDLMDVAVTRCVFDLSVVDIYISVEDRDVC